MGAQRRSRGRTLGAGGFTDMDYCYFATGAFFEAENYEVGKTKAEICTFWFSHRAALLARFLEENRAKGPGWGGLRPWPFWELEPRAPRRKTAPKEYESQKVWDRRRRCYAWVERDIEYLRRLGLLEPWELAATTSPSPMRAGE